MIEINVFNAMLAMVCATTLVIVLTAIIREMVRCVSN